MPSRHLPSLPGLRVFESAARHLSFQQAAAELALSPTAVSHAVRALEAQLGVPLFARLHRKVRLTAEGEVLARRLTAALDDIVGAVQAISPDRRHARLTVTATHAFTAHWLVPRLWSFRAAHPDIDLMLMASDEVIDLAAGQADLAIRCTDTPPPGAELLAAERLTPLIAPALPVRTLEDLREAPRIVYSWNNQRVRNLCWDAWLPMAGLLPEAAGPVLRFNEETHAIHAAISGEGAVLAGRFMLGDRILDGSLVAPFDADLEPGGYYLVTGPRAGAGAAVFADWLRARAAGETTLNGDTDDLRHDERSQP